MLAMFGMGYLEILIVSLIILGVSVPVLIVVLVLVFSTAKSRQQTDGNPNLVSCPDCGRSVSLQAEQCPQCGRPLKPQS